jgi:hypothetical protein
MRTVTLPLPVFGFVVATRAAIGAGLALLLAKRLSDDQRRRVGFALLAAGAASTIPAARWLSRGIRRERPSFAGTERDRRLIGATRYARKGDDAF